MSPSGRQCLLAAVAVGFLTIALPAQAIPAFARKYGTSCMTCHTVYPKLTPFGEGFRRNGYRFPGIDSDFVKKEPVALGQESSKKLFPTTVWPGILPGEVPLALGFNGQAIIHPNPSSGGGQADNGTIFTTRDLVAEAHLWAGGSYDDRLTFFGELTVAESGAEIERAQVFFNDLFGHKHALNLAVGRGFADLTSFGPHSTYLADTLIPTVPVTGLYGATTDSFALTGEYSGLELRGVLFGRFDYALGLNAGATIDVRPTENVYAHAGYKLGGIRLDDEGTTGPTDAKRPWAERALTLDVFAYHSNSNFMNAAGDRQSDSAFTIGGALRAQWESLELDTGLYHESHNHAQVDGTSATALVQYNELSYVVFPWLVPAVRFEYLRLSAADGTVADDVRLFAGVATLIRPNLKFTLVGQLESSSAAPLGGWSPAGGMAAPTTGPVGLELEAISVGLSTAF